jgi:hypothetical protein
MDYMKMNDTIDQMLEKMILSTWMSLDILVAMADGAATP